MFFVDLTLAPLERARFSLLIVITPTQGYAIVFDNFAHVSTLRSSTRSESLLPRRRAVDRFNTSRGGCGCLLGV
jgi:hypothetical protein